MFKEKEISDTGKNDQHKLLAASGFWLKGKEFSKSSPTFPVVPTVAATGKR